MILVCCARLLGDLVSLNAVSNSVHLFLAFSFLDFAAVPNTCLAIATVSHQSTTSRESTFLFDLLFCLVVDGFYEYCCTSV